MNNEFIPYEQALTLKELGFDEPCLKYWNGIGEYFDQKDWFNWNQSKKFVSIPLYQQAFRWFREKHGLDYEITYGGKKGEYCAFVKSYIYGNNGNNPSIFSYEEAELECLKKLIEIVKNK
jgi:hypothetical protein